MAKRTGSSHLVPSCRYQMAALLQSVRVQQRQCSYTNLSLASYGPEQ